MQVSAAALYSRLQQYCQISITVFQDTVHHLFLLDALHGENFLDYVGMHLTRNDEQGQGYSTL